MWFLGVLVILFFYISIGEYLGSSMFHIHLNFFHGILFLLFGIVIILLMKLNLKKIVVLWWVLLTIIPGGSFIIYQYNNQGTGGWVSFPWDWGLWELFLPVILGITQIISIAIINIFKDKA